MTEDKTKIFNFEVEIVRLKQGINEKLERAKKEIIKFKKVKVLPIDAQNYLLHKNNR